LHDIFLIAAPDSSRWHETRADPASRNALHRFFVGAAANAARRRDNRRGPMLRGLVVHRFGPYELHPHSRTAVNARRIVLGLASTAELTPDTKLDAGLSETARPVAVNKQSALRTGPAPAATLSKVSGRSRGVDHADKGRSRSLTNRAARRIAGARVRNGGSVPRRTQGDGTLSVP
jgi:hypothetical protein